MKPLKLIISFFILSCQFSIAQVNPLEIIDKVAGTLLPTIVNGVKDIRDAKRKDKDDEAKKLEDTFKKEKELAIAEAKISVLKQIGDDIEFLEAINSAQIKVQQIGIDVGRLSLFKDINFIDDLLSQNNPKIKNEVVRKFQNALQQVYANKPDLNTLRTKLISTSIPANSKVAIYIGSINSKLEEINSTYDDCSKLTILNNNPKMINGCLKAIRSLSNDISVLENQVENLSAESSVMLATYIMNFKTIEKKANP